MFPQAPSLVKFSTPVLVSISGWIHYYLGKKIVGEKVPGEIDSNSETHKI